MSYPDVTSQPPDPVARLAALPADAVSEMYSQLVNKLDHARRCEPTWVMDLDHYKQMRRTAAKPGDDDDEDEWRPDIEDRLLGRRILVRDGGGEPHIEWMTPDEAKAAAQ